MKKLQDSKKRKFGLKRILLEKDLKKADKTEMEEVLSIQSQTKRS